MLVWGHGRPARDSDTPGNVEAEMLGISYDMTVSRMPTSKADLSCFCPKLNTP
jgi:hypothetical protein